MIDVVMPQLGESVTEGTIVSWRKAVGEAVTAEELLCEVSTDKVTFEVPSPGEGILSEILAAEDQTVAMGAVIARISGGDVPPETTQAALSKETAPASVEASVEAPAAPAPHAAGKPRPSPLARRLARDNGIDLASLTGSGARGRVRGEDVRKAIARQSLSGGPVPPDTPRSLQHGSSGPDPAMHAKMGDRVIPFSPARRQIAEHMVRSVRTSPHGYIAFEVDYGAIEQARAAVKDRFRADEGFGLTYLPFVLYAVSKALRAYPLINSTVEGDSLIVRRELNLGIAVDLNHQGLVVPVIQNADSLNVVGLARAVADLARRARENRLSADDMAGGTFTVTNPGPSGTFFSVPIINQPQAAILVTDGVTRRPSVVTQPDGSDALAIRPMGTIGLSMDHRAFDGAYAADFLATIKEMMESTAWREEFANSQPR